MLRKGLFIVSVFHVQQQVDQRCGVLWFGIIQTAGKAGNGIFDIVWFECFLEIWRKGKTLLCGRINF